MTFTSPQIILFVADVERAAQFYAGFGFVETFRHPEVKPDKIETVLAGFELGFALPGPAAQSHGIDPVTEGHRACLTLWTDDVAAAHQAALNAGAKDHRGPHQFRGGELMVAFVEDLDGHPIQFVERVK